MAVKKITITKDGQTRGIDLTNTTATPDTVLLGRVFKQADGTDGVGTLEQSSGAELNIHYGDTAPEDTSKLWVEGNMPSKVFLASDVTIKPKLLTSRIAYPYEAGDIRSATVKKNIWCFGGQGYPDKYSSTIQALTAIVVFDTITQTLRVSDTVLPFTKPEAAVSIDDKIYLPYANSDTSTTDLYEFDTQTETIKKLPSFLSHRRTAATYLASDGFIYVFGGNGYGNDTSKNKVFKYNPKTYSVTTSSTVLSGTLTDSEGVVVDKKAYLFGGYFNNAMSNIILIYDTVTDTLKTSSATLSERVVYHCLGVIQNRIYRFGGYSLDTSDGLKCDAYDIATDSVSNVSIQFGSAIGGDTDVSSSSVGECVYFFGGIGTTGSRPRKDDIRTFNYAPTVDKDDILLQTTTTENIFKLLKSDTVDLDMGVVKASRAMSNIAAESETCWVYKTSKWYLVSYASDVFTFTVDGTTNYARANMTWADWITSPFNMNSYRISGTTVYVSGGWIDDVTPSDVITEGAAYTVTYSGGGGSD